MIYPRKYVIQPVYSNGYNFFLLIKTNTHKITSLPGIVIAVIHFLNFACCFTIKGHNIIHKNASNTE